MAQDKKSKDTYEMLWDCKFCGTAKLLGVTHRYCPNCGAAQDAAQRYFPADDEKIAVKDHQYVGADKVCEACDTPNAGNAEFCTNCGAPLSDAARARQLAAEKRAHDQKFSRSGAKDQTAREKLLQAQAAEQTQKNSRMKWIIISALVVILALVAVFLVWTKEVSVIATGHAWQRVVQIEDYNMRSAGDWCDEKPGDAYNISRSEKVRSHKRVPDGEECSTQRIDQGDGTYREQEECHTKYKEEPVYDTYCNYSIDRWAHKRDAQAEGKDKKPLWPTYQLACEGEQRKGCERESGRSENYVLLLENTETHESYECSLEKALWENAQVDSQWKLNVSGMTGGARCSSLQPLDH